MAHDERHDNTTAGPIPSVLAAPEIPDHQLLRRIGKGACGEVWLAKSLTGAYRAIKVVYLDSITGAAEREFAAIQKFEPISRGHESQIDILHVGKNVNGGYFYYVMELADDANAQTEDRMVATHGASTPADVKQASEFSATSYEAKTLRIVLERRGRLPLEECIGIGLALTSALSHLHGHGLVHRDIKPSNIIFVDGLAKLADIGLINEAEGALSFVGTEGYVPREGPGSPRSDIYGLGKVLYEMFTGLDRNFFPRLPDGDGQPQGESFHRFNEIVLHACDSEVDRRYQTVEDIHADLLLLQNGVATGPSRSGLRRFSLAARVSMIISLVALVVVWFSLSDRSSTSGLPFGERLRYLALGGKSVGFKVLFNGIDLDGWNAPAGNWESIEGSLAAVRSGGDITYDKEPIPDDFDLRFEWKVASGTDSGILYRPGRVEYQILDNRGSVLGTDSRTRAGSLYDYDSVGKDVTKPVGQWNEGRILCRGSRIQHYLNGSKVLDTDYASPEWKAQRDTLARKYGTNLSSRGGYLVLRDEHGPVWYRRLRLRKLD